jgi:hypothetical protein
MFEKNDINNFLHCFVAVADETFNNKNFLYDYNEVQELYFDRAHNYFVCLAGITGLNKTKLLKKIISDLAKSGVATSDIIYADFELPFIRDLSLDEIINHFPKRTDSNLYLVINEIGLKEQFFYDVKKVREQHPNVRLLASCSIPFLVYEYLQDTPNDYSKVVVLSPKNESNIKSESDTFGVDNNLKYNIKNGICEIKGMTKEGKSQIKHIIPSKINGYTVKVIASGAFHHRRELTEIELPDTIEYIGDYAFTRCENLREIKLPKNLTYIGDCAFLGATNLKTIIGGNSIAHIGCSALYATAWNENQTSDFVVLGKVLYRYKGSKSSVMLPKNVSVLGCYAFRNTDTDEIELSGIESIEEGCFYGCKKLSTVKNYPYRDINAFTFYNCGVLSMFSNRIKNIAKFAFGKCASLNDLVVDNTEIGTGAFENCNSLTTINGSIKSVGKCAFYHAAVEQAEVKDATYIGDFAFSGTRFSKILLQTVQVIGQYAFADIDRLKEAYIQNYAEIGERVFWRCRSITCAKLSGKYPLDYYFGGKPEIEKLSVNGDCCDNFCRDNSALKKVAIFNGRVGNWAFYNNTNLVEVNLQKCNGIIGAWAFAYCGNIQDVLIPKNVRYIEMNAFRYCRKLSKIELQAEEPVMFGANAFYSTSKDKEIFVVNKQLYQNILIWQEYKTNLRESESVLSMQSRS